MEAAGNTRLGVPALFLGLVWGPRTCAVALAFPEIQLVPQGGGQLGVGQDEDGRELCSLAQTLPMDMEGELSCGG